MLCARPQAVVAQLAVHALVKAFRALASYRLLRTAVRVESGTVWLAIRGVGREMVIALALLGLAPILAALAAALALAASLERGVAVHMHRAAWRENHWDLGRLRGVRCGANWQRQQMERDLGVLHVVEEQAVDRQVAGRVHPEAAPGCFAYSLE